MFVKAATPVANPTVKREASRIASAQARPLDRAAAALKLAKQDVRYIYVGLIRAFARNCDYAWRIGALGFEEIETYVFFEIVQT